MVSLTGDVGTGKAIARAAADTLKRVHLELGGKAPVIVFDDADLEAVVEGVKIAGYFNAGQDCTAATRVLAGPGPLRRLRVGRWPTPPARWVGDPGDEDTELGRSSPAPSAIASRGFLDRAPGTPRPSPAAGRQRRRVLLRADGRRRASRRTTRWSSARSSGPS